MSGTIINISPRIVILDRLGRLFPRFFWQRYSSLARKQGFDRLYLVLSFDCDTPEDARAAQTIHDRLVKLNIMGTYAVPGSQLEENGEIYRVIATKGGEFINHGARPHTVWQGDHYQSSAFYNLMTSNEIVEDIQKGHEIVTQITGISPSGFRGPHFGRFQKPENLSLVFNTIKELGYSFSSTTVPEFAFRYGTVWRTQQGITEFPLSGSTRAPISLLDSYTYIRSSEDRTVTTGYGRLLKETISRLVEWKIAGILNIYVDPSHVVEDPGFFEALQLTNDLEIPSANYPEILSRLK
jgi:hypothetical protein